MKELPAVILNEVTATRLIHFHRQLGNQIPTQHPPLLPKNTIIYHLTMSSKITKYHEEKIITNQILQLLQFTEDWHILSDRELKEI